MKAISRVLLAAVATCAMTMAASAQTTLRISLWIPPAHPLAPSTQAWADDIEKASGGAIKPQVFASEQLGKAFDHYDMGRDGIADVAFVNPGYQPGRCPVISAGEIPFTFADARKGTAALDTWYRKYAAAEMKDVHFCFAFIHDPGALFARKKIVVPDDIKGVKMRPAHGTMGQLVTLLGGTNVQASAPEARELLERGVADAISSPWGSMFLFGIDKVVKYAMNTPLYTTTFVYVMNKAKYEGLPAEQKKVIDDHCTTEWAVKIAGPWADFEHAGIEKMQQAPGHEVYELTPEQLNAWRAAAKPLQEKWADAVRKTGVDPVAARAELDAAIAKNGAGL